jgi:hypothetical protein
VSKLFWSNVSSLATKIGDFVRVHGIDRKMVATIAIGRDLAFAQQFWHGFLRNSCFFQARECLIKADPAALRCQDAARRV